MNFVDLFAGAGGLSYGLENAGHNAIVAVDRDEKACETYRHNMPTACIQRDLSSREPLPVSSKMTDMVCGGPPCNEFSVNRNKKSNMDNRRLVKDFYYYVEELDPSVVIMENVQGILREDDDLMEWIHKRLGNLGYNSFDKIISANNFGIPQDRNRLFVIGRKSGDIRFPKSNNKQSSVGNCLSQVNKGHENQVKPKQKQKTIDRIANTKQGEPLYDSWSQRIRLSSKGHAPTLVCGGPRPQWQLAHPTKNRGLTVHERALLQTFPTDYVFKGGVVSGRVQTGNAVPPKLAKIIGEGLKPKKDRDSAYQYAVKQNPSSQQVNGYTQIETDNPFNF